MEPRRAILWCIATLFGSLTGVLGGAPDPAASVSAGSTLHERAADLVKQLTLEEKVNQLFTDAPEIPRVGLPAFNYWAEGQHGFVSWELPGGTMFPSPLAFGATFDTALVREVGSIVSDEARAYYNQEMAASGKPRGFLNLFDPNINIFRDPRWGRGSEVFGEDPDLMSAMVVAFVKGLQGNHSHFLKTVATCKHFAAYSLEQAEGITRHNFDAQASARDLMDTYLPAFKACVQEAKAGSIMCAYNRVNGGPACANKYLLQDTLRKQWGFQGFVVSDCGAVSDIALHHRVQPSMPAAVAATTSAGCDMNCDDAFHSLIPAVKQGFLNESDIDTALTRILTSRFKLGLFEPQDKDPWRGITMDVVGSTAHLEAARKVAQRSIVLLYNPRGMLPLKFERGVHSTEEQYKGIFPLGSEEREGGDKGVGVRGRVSRVGVIGPLADEVEPLLGPYYGKPAGEVITPLKAIQQRIGKDNVRYSAVLEATVCANADGIFAATELAEDVDVVVVFVGSSQGRLYGSKGGRVQPISESEGMDRTSLRLPGLQEDLVRAATRAGKPVVVVLIHGGPVDVRPLMEMPHVAAILTAWYPGQGAQAIADILFGDVSPSGRLPVSFYHDNYTQIQSALNMDMSKWPGRTHRYLQVPVLFPFGHGLSYSNITYSGLRVRRCTHPHPDPSCGSVEVQVINNGPLFTEEVVLVMWKKGKGWWSEGSPLQGLLRFRRVALPVGTITMVTFNVSSAHLPPSLVGTHPDTISRRSQSPDDRKHSGVTQRRHVSVYVGTGLLEADWEVTSAAGEKLGHTVETE